MNNYRGESYLTIRQADGTLALLPPWMADEDAALVSVVLKPALPHPVLVELLRLVDAALSSLRCRHVRESAMRRLVMGAQQGTREFLS